jgi:chemotaxis protein MotB
MAAGLEDGKILRVVGLASSVPLNAADPFDAQNRRISIVVFNRDAAEAITRDGPAIDVADPASAREALATVPGPQPGAAPQAPQTAPHPGNTSLLRAPIR